VIKPARHSRLAVWLAAIYLIAAVGCYAHALFICRQDFLCGLEVVPVYFPAGTIYSTLFERPALEWIVSVPTVITNAAFYYAIGRAIAWTRRPRP
jgi:hypothetical protein